MTRKAKNSKVVQSLPVFMCGRMKFSGLFDVWSPFAPAPSAESPWFVSYSGIVGNFVVSLLFLHVFVGNTFLGRISSLAPGDVMTCVCVFAPLFLAPCVSAVLAYAYAYACTHTHAVTQNVIQSFDSRQDLLNPTKRPAKGLEKAIILAKAERGSMAEVSDGVTCPRDQASVL